MNETIYLKCDVLDKDTYQPGLVDPEWKNYCKQLKDKGEFLSIMKSIDGLDGQQYGLLMGFYNTLCYAPVTLIIGGYTDKINRKNLILISCIFGSCITILNSWATKIDHLIILKVMNGFVSGLF